MTRPSTHSLILLFSTIVAVAIFNSPNCYAQTETTQNSCDSGLALDWNCDGSQHISVLGDSFVYGVGDTKLKTLSGYIGRTRKALQKIKIDGFGTRGLETGQLLNQLKAVFSSNESSSLLDSLLKADVIFLDLGRNDRWSFGPPSDAFDNLVSIRKLIQTSVAEQTGITPIVIIDVLMLPNRGAQGPWVKELNKIILDSHKLTTPANLRFDLVSKRLIGKDQIHPTSRGYAALSKSFVSYLKKTLPAMIKKLRLI